ncbi:MAG TPA: hypothetical protein VES94_05680 [Burkholderiales bacterium]|nr:hypothetical protein [Burkholderiales bacterium]
MTKSERMRAFDMNGDLAEQFAQVSFLNGKGFLLFPSLFFLRVLCVESSGVEST